MSCHCCSQVDPVANQQSEAVGYSQKCLWKKVNNLIPGCRTNCQFHLKIDVAILQVMHVYLCSAVTSYDAIVHSIILSNNNNN